MSEIQRYAADSEGRVMGEPREEWVLFTDHEAAIEKLNVEIAGKGREIARLDAALAEKQQVLADAKARIEGERIESDGMDSWENGYHTGIDAALAALTQPQTEQWHENDEADKAATAAGVADADLEAAAMEISVKATRLDPETYKVPDKLIWMLRSALFPNEDMERIKSPGPYAKAFRERVCPVPDWPTILGEKEESDAT